MSNNKFSNIILNKDLITINLLNLNKLSDSLIEIPAHSLYKIIKLQNKNVENFLQNFIIFDFYASVSNENSNENSDNENLDEIFKNFLKDKKFFIVTVKKYFNKNKFKNFDINNYIQINKFSLSKIFQKFNNKTIIENYDYISITLMLLSQKEIEKRKKILEKIDNNKNSIKIFPKNNENFSTNFNLISTENNNNSIIIHSSSNESEILSNFSEKEFLFFKLKTKKNKKLLKQNLEILNIFINNATKIKNNKKNLNKENSLFESLNTISDYFNEKSTLNTINNSNEKIIIKKIKKKKSNFISNNFNNFSFNNFSNNYNNNFNKKHFYSKSDINNENKKTTLKSKKFYLIKDIFKKKRIINKNDLENINEAFNNNKININNLINVFDVYNKIIYISYSQIKNLMNNLEENLYLKLINNKNVKVYVNKNKIFKIFEQNKNLEKFEIEDYLNKKHIIKFNKNIKDKFLLHSPVWKSIRNIYCMKIRKIHKK